MTTEDVQIIDSMLEIPLVSIVMATYNRALTIGRAVNSVLGQTYKNVELIIIDDGSTDNTIEVLNSIKDSKIRVYCHEKNKGVTAAKNSGLDQIKGEWFTILDSDDEITPEAIETMMNMPLNIDKSVTAVSCNCWDTSKQAFSGMGLGKDQYIDVNMLMTVLEGEFWGITKTSLLKDERFNEKLRGVEGTLWYKINDRANRYYFHQALRIYHTEGDDRIMKSKYDFNREVVLYTNLIVETHYLDTKKKYVLPAFKDICKNGLVTMRTVDKKDIALQYYKLLKPVSKNPVIDLIFKYKIVALLMRSYIKYKIILRPYALSLFKKRK